MSAGGIAGAGLVDYAAGSIDVRCIPAASKSNGIDDASVMCFCEVDTAAFPTAEPGNRRAIGWVVRRSKGTTVLAAVEGTSSYGANITAALTATGIEVAEIRLLSRPSRARTGKSDRIDAEAAARAVLGEDITRPAQPRRTGDRAALRVLLAARSLMDQQRTANRNALTALLRSFDLGIDARNRSQTRKS